MQRSSIASIAAGLLLLGCTSGESTETTTTSPPTTSQGVTEEAPTGPSPGVSGDAIKVGIPVVDVAAISQIIDVDPGDYQEVYTALFDDINAGGGIHGRSLEPIFAMVTPVGTGSAEEACVRLTEDEDVFVAMGFFLGDTVMCYVETHETAVVGGTMSAERLERARAPWYAIGSADLSADVIEAMAEAGELDGTLAVYAGPEDADRLDSEILPLLEELGVEPVATGVMDAPQDDPAAVRTTTGVAAERFRSADVDTVLLVGTSAQAWGITMVDQPYRPKLLFTSAPSIGAFTDDEAGYDTSLLEGSALGSTYGPTQSSFEEPNMQRCIGVLEDAGIDVPVPAEVEPDVMTYTAAMESCRNVALLRALLEAAGQDLNYGTLVAGVDGLAVDIPGDPVPFTYGPPPAADGQPAVYLFSWDQAARDWARRDG